MEAQAWYGHALRVESERSATWEAYQDVSRELGDRLGMALADQAFEALADGLLPTLPPEATV